MMLRKCSNDHSRKKKKEKVGDRVSNPVGFPKKKFYWPRKNFSYQVTVE